LEQSGQEKTDAPAVHGEAVVPEIWENWGVILKRVIIYEALFMKWAIMMCLSVKRPRKDYIP
jgi:hypothetical protein